MQLQNSLAVVGGGVLGLHVALEAVRRGFAVTIYSDRRIEQTTSWKAAASFKPFDTSYTPLIESLVERSWIGYEKLLADYGPKTGIRLHTHWEASKYEIQTRWYLHLMKNVIHCKAPQIPGNYRSAWRYETFFIEMPIFLTWLKNRLASLGVKFIQRRFNVLDDLIALPQEIIVNTTGYGAKKLVGDLELEAKKGQTVSLDLPMPMQWSISADGYYTYPRSNETLLGGTMEQGVSNEMIFPEAIEMIIEGNAPILHGIKKIPIKSAAAGIRPFRLSGPRIESEAVAGKLVLHNYGHGGSGVTMAPGSAEALFNLEF